MAKSKETEQTIEQTNEERTFTPRSEIFFFPNTGVGEHQSYEAATREEAEALNQQYLDDLTAEKETN